MAFFQFHLKVELKCSHYNLLNKTEKVLAKYFKFQIHDLCTIFKILLSLRRKISKGQNIKFLMKYINTVFEILHFSQHTEFILMSRTYNSK